MIRRSVIFDVGRVLFDWDLRYLFAKLIAEKDELDWFVTNIVTPEWHFQHDAGRPLAEMVPASCTADRRLCAALQRDDPGADARQPRTRRAPRRGGRAALRDHQFRA
jgi:hypothetical protein